MVVATDTYVVVIAQDMCGTPQYQASECGPVPWEHGAGPRETNTLDPVPEYLILHHAWARGSLNDYFCHLSSY